MTDPKELRRLAAKTLEGEPMTPAQLMEAYDLSDIAEMLFEANTLRIKDAQAVTALLDALEETYTDSKDTVWTRPTAEAYANVCAACLKHYDERESATVALEKAEADQLRGRLAKEFARGAREGWMRAYVFAVDIDAESDPAVIIQMNGRWPEPVVEALATPHTAATPYEDAVDKFMGSHGDSFPFYQRDHARELLLRFLQNFNPAKHAPADSVQVRTPGTVEVCQLCKQPIDGSPPGLCWRTGVRYSLSAFCPMRPTSPDPARATGREGK